MAACTEAEELHPDIVIMDLSMPDLSGIDAMKRIHERRPDLPVVILTAHADEGVEREAREAGASGFLAKGTGLHDLVIVLHEAADRTRLNRCRPRRPGSRARARHSPISSPLENTGLSSNGWKSHETSASVVRSVAAVTVAERTPPSISPISPK